MDSERMKGKEGRLGYYIHKDFCKKKAQQILVWEKSVVKNNRFYSEMIYFANTSVPKGKNIFSFCSYEIYLLF